MNNDDEQKPQPRKPLIQPRPRIKEEILVRRKKKARKPKKDSDEDYSAKSNEDESIEDESKSDAGKNDNSNDADNELINESTHKSENNDIDDCSINKRKRDESENEGGEDIELEDQENIAITTSNDNPFILAWIDGVFNENYHERNDEYTTHNIIIITPNDWGGDRIPTEEMANDSFEEFRGLNPRFINYKAHTVEELLKYFWEFMSSLFMRVHKDGTAKFIGWHVTQLNTDLKRKFPKRRKISNNWRDTLNWQQTKEGALEDEIAWNCRQKPFDDKKKMAKVAQKFKEDLGVGYAQRNKKGWIEKTNGYSKRLTQKSLQDKRKNSHGKLVNSSSKNNVVAKKNKPEENTVFKRKKGQFHSTRFVHFLKPDGPGHFNDWILANGGTEKDKIEIEIVPSTKKPRPSMKMK